MTACSSAPNCTLRKGDSSGLRGAGILHARSELVQGRANPLLRRGEVSPGARHGIQARRRRDETAAADPGEHLLGGEVTGE